MIKATAHKYLNIHLILNEDVPAIGQVARVQSVTAYWVHEGGEWVFYTWTVTGPEQGLTGQLRTESNISRATPDWLKELIAHHRPV